MDMAVLGEGWQQVRAVASLGAGDDMLKTELFLPTPHG